MPYLDGKEEVKNMDKHPLFDGAAPPLYDENGKLITDRYVTTIRIPGRGEMAKSFASEWGALGYIESAIDLASEGGQRQVKITLTVEPGEKTGTLGKDPGAPVQ